MNEGPKNIYRNIYTTNFSVMKVDFKKIKAEISLPDFLLQLGWKFASGSSNSSPKMTNGQQTIVIKKNKEGQYTYWNVHGEERGKSIVDFMQQHLYNETGRLPTLREVGERLQSYIDNQDVILSTNSKYSVSNSKLDNSQLSMLINQLKPYTGNFLEQRGISRQAIDSPTFSNVFTSRTYAKDGRKYNNTCIKLINTEGFQGISQRGVREEDHKSFKGILGNKYGSIAVSNWDKSKPIDQIYIGESMIDCISHYEMKNLNDTRNFLYISTEGNLTQGQMELIKKIIDHQGTKSISTIFDNDKNGYKYTLKLDRFLKHEPFDNIESMSTEELREKVNLLSNVELSINSDWNDDLKEIVLQKKESEFQEAIKKNDFERLINISKERFIPSQNIIKILSDSFIPEQTLITIQKIFDVKLDISVENNLNLAQNRDQPQSLKNNNDLTADLS